MRKLFLQDLGCLLFSETWYNNFHFKVGEYFLGFNKGIVDVPIKTEMINYLYEKHELKFINVREENVSFAGYISELNPYFEIPEEEIFYIKLKYVVDLF